MKKIYFMVAMLAILINALALDRMSFADMVPTSDPYDVVIRIGAWNTDRTVFNDYEVISFAGTGSKDKDRRELIKRLNEINERGGVEYYYDLSCKDRFYIDINHVEKGGMRSPEDCDEYQVYVIDGLIYGESECA